MVFIGDPDGEPARLIREFEVGACIACGDSEGLRAALCRLRGDPAGRERMSVNARKLFEDRYTLGAAVGRWQKILSAVAAHAAGGGDG